LAENRSFSGSAARKGKGDLVWLGYQPKPNKSGNWNAPRVLFGTTLVCITQAAAERIVRIMGTGFWQANHIDVWLLKFVQDFRFSPGRCSYLFPPLGSFGAHQSECCPSEGQRQSWWNEDFTAQGKRPCEDAKNNRSKDIYAFTPDGKVHCDFQVALKDE